MLILSFLHLKEKIMHDIHLDVSVPIILGVHFFLYVLSIHL